MDDNNDNPAPVIITGVESRRLRDIYKLVEEGVRNDERFKDYRQESLNLNAMVKSHARAAAQSHTHYISDEDGLKNLNLLLKNSRNWRGTVITQGFDKARLRRGVEGFLGANFSDRHVRVVEEED